MKYVDRKVDRLTVRIDRLVEKNRLLSSELSDLGRLLRAYISEDID